MTPDQIEAALDEAFAAVERRSSHFKRRAAARNTRIVALAAAGRNAKQIAFAVKCSINTVYVAMRAA